MKKIITIIGICISLSVSAQKRNIIHFGGLFYDYLIAAESEDDELMFANKTGFTAGYDRLVGNRISVGLRYSYYFGGGDEGTHISLNNSGISGVPAGTSIGSAVFQEKGGGFNYESKYFFDDFDSDGANSGYIGMVITRLNFTETIKDIDAQDNNYNAVHINDRENDYGITRIGIKYGGITSGALSSEFYIAGYMNFAKDKGNLFPSPTRVADYSFAIGWLIGVPF
jgi:hypothetical protein